MKDTTLATQRIALMALPSRFAADHSEDFSDGLGRSQEFTLADWYGDDLEATAMDRLVNRLADSASALEEENEGVGDALLGVRLYAVEDTTVMVTGPDGVDRGVSMPRVALARATPSSHPATAAGLAEWAALVCSAVLAHRQATTPNTTGHTIPVRNEETAVWAAGREGAR